MDPKSIKPRRSLAEIAAAYAGKTSEGGPGQNWKLFFPFWKMPVDTTTTVRFLPDKNEENPLAFLVENRTHELVINGKAETVACLKMYGEDCPICDLSSTFYDAEDKTMGKKYYHKKSYIGSVLVVETQVEHDASVLNKLIEFGPQVFNQINAGYRSGDFDESPESLKGGYNFRIRKTLTGDGRNSYSTSSFAPKQTDVSDEIIEKLELYNLTDYRAPKVERATLETMLQAARLTENVPLAPRVPRAETVQPQAESSSSAPVLEAPSGNKLSVVEMLKARMANTASSQE